MPATELSSTARQRRAESTATHHAAVAPMPRHIDVVHVFRSVRRQRRHLDARTDRPSTVQFCCGFRFAVF